MSFRTMKDVEMKKAFCSKTILHLRLFTRKLSDKYMLLAGLLACSPVNHLPITFMATVVLLICTGVKTAGVQWYNIKQHLNC